MVFLPNPPVKDAACGEADKSLRLPCEMRRLFLWGYAQKTILLRRINPRNIKYMPAVIVIACLFIPFFQRGILNKNPLLCMDTI